MLEYRIAYLTVIVFLAFGIRVKL